MSLYHVDVLFVNQPEWDIFWNCLVKKEIWKKKMRKRNLVICIADCLLKVGKRDDISNRVFIRIRLAQLIFFCCTLTLLRLCPVGCLSLAFLNLMLQGQNRHTSTILLLTLIKRSVEGTTYWLFKVLYVLSSFGLLSLT